MYPSPGFVPWNEATLVGIVEPLLKPRPGFRNPFCVAPLPLLNQPQTFRNDIVLRRKPPKFHLLANPLDDFVADRKVHYTILRHDQVVPVPGPGNVPPGVTLGNQILKTT